MGKVFFESFTMQLVVAVVAGAGSSLSTLDQVFKGYPNDHSDLTHCELTALFASEARSSKTGVSSKSQARLHHLLTK